MYSRGILLLPFKISDLSQHRFDLILLLQPQLRFHTVYFLLQKDEYIWRILIFKHLQLQLFQQFFLIFEILYFIRYFLYSLIDLFLLYFLDDGYIALAFAVSIAHVEVWLA